MTEWEIGMQNDATFHLALTQAAIRRESLKNSRLLTQLLATQQVIAQGIEYLEDCLDRYVQDGVDLSDFN